MPNNPFAHVGNADKLAMERRALLIQVGGYTYYGNEKLYSKEGRFHLEAVTARKERESKATGNRHA